MDEPRRKLAKLEELIPGTNNEMIYDFGRFVSPYLNPELIPLGFVRLCEAAIHDLTHGVSGGIRQTHCQSSRRSFAYDLCQAAYGNLQHCRRDLPEGIRGRCKGFGEHERREKAF